MKKTILLSILSIALLGCNTQKTISFASRLNNFDRDVDFYYKRTGLKFFWAEKINDSTVFVIMKK